MEVGINDWIKRWLFAISLSLAILIPISVFFVEAFTWSSSQQSWSLPITVYGFLVASVIVLLPVALGAIITRQSQRNPWMKAKYYGLVILTLVFNAICWWVIWLISYGYVT
jgi:hypothetical protein